MNKFFTKDYNFYLHGHIMDFVLVNSNTQYSRHSKDDLKGLINAKGRKHAEGEKLPPGEPNLEMYLKLAENFMKKGHFESALYWIGEAADFNSESAVSVAKYF